MQDDPRIPSRYRFRKRERIRSRSDIRRVFSEGARHSVRGMGLYVAPNDGPVTRAVFVTVRKYGNAVERNRARRVVSECWRLAKPDARPGFDAVFVIYRGPDSMADREPQVRALARRAGLVA